MEVKDGLIRFVDVEGHVDNSDYEDEGGTVTVKHEDEFENVTIKRRDGRVVDVKRSLPTKFSARPTPWEQRARERPERPARQAR